MQAAGPTTWELSQYSEFAKGKLRGVSLTRGGVLEPGLRVELNPALRTGETSLWSAANTTDGGLLLGTGPRGQIFRWNATTNQLQALGSPAPGHAFAVAVDRTGTIFAGLSPSGAIYRRKAGAWEHYAALPASYIWALLASPDGALWAATGPEGKLFRIANGQPELWWESGQANLTSLAWDRDQSLLVGSDPNGILYRVSAKGTARALFDAPFAEIRTVLPAPSGEIFFLAMGGAAAKRATGLAPAGPGGATSGVPQVTTTITVTEDAAQSGLDIKPKAGAPASPTPQQTPLAPASVYELPGVDRSAIYRLNADQTVDSLYVTKEEAIFDIVWHAGRIHFSSDSQGRLYRLDGERQPALLAESGASELGRLFAVGSDFAALATGAGQLLRFSAQPAAEGEYESPVHEAPSLSLWGAFQATSSGTLRFESRSGNSARPDATWSPWEPLRDSRIASPTARYLQWRMKTQGGFSLRAATVHYLGRNQAPSVKSIGAALNVSAVKPATAGSTATASAVYTLTVTDTGEASSSTSAGANPILPARPLSRQLFLNWTAEDPDADTLHFRIDFRAEEENSWKTLKEHLTETSYFIDADTLADGRYYFRVTASDEASNTVGTARRGELTSAPIHLDQTAPELTLNLSGAIISVRALDQSSGIRRLEYSINSGPWHGLDSADGILDMRQESATIDTATLQLPAGEHTVTVRAFDAAFNVAIRKVTVTK